ncbi:hypothetical protein FRC10_011578 [Ceratobasidium sp. 414]|nr:hypothetical protein FRC10_011578 [Ceratobasidium sp. 414]
MVGKRMKREILPREPQVSVGGIVGGMVIVLLAVGGWFWWGSRVRAAKTKSAKSRRAQELDQRRMAGRGRAESSETLHNGAQSKPDSRMSEKPGTNPATEPVKKPSAILSEKPKPSPHRSPFNHTNVSSTSLASSKYAPSRPSPLALGVITRSSSAMSDAPPIPGLPSVNVVPASPTVPVRALLSPAEPDRTQRRSVQSTHSVQSAASEYSTDSAVGVAYGGDEAEQEAYKHPRDEWLESKKSAVGRVRPPPPMRR